ncbi:CoA ester lyase [Pseudarthrobacter sp. fls2-241-R2A-168]|uniref:HpcH/HpaI aldolase/citrate lyase family protein n=1 Tax=Pseudarthrobacter sp. fls2-241-R2A-168 TaxID=3040304 RepID=UPI00255692CB|nr:CoA ester lyase [Pseudarthrobacter sp. fls2-241-R2A-168]
MTTSRSVGRWYRSFLWVPGHKPAWAPKAINTQVDALFLDLEDSVPIANKAEGRQGIREMLEAHASENVGLFARVNGWGTGELIADVDGIVAPGLDGIMLAKCESRDHVSALSLVLDELEAARGLPIGGIEIVPCIESPAGLHHLYDICMASQRVKRVNGLGVAAPGGDFAGSLNIRLSPDAREGNLYALAAMTAARAAGVTQILGGPATDVANLDVVREVHEQARALGATSGHVIHPSHVAIVNEIYSPSQEEIQEAVELMEALTEAVEAGHAAVRHKGHMIDYAHARAILDLLERAHQSGLFAGPVPQLPVLSH